MKANKGSETGGVGGVPRGGSPGGGDAARVGGSAMSDVLRAGDLIQITRGGPVYYVEMVNQSRAHCIPLNPANEMLLREGKKLIEEGHEVEYEFIGQGINISPASSVIHVTLEGVEKDRRAHMEDESGLTETAAPIPVAPKSTRDREKERKEAMAAKKAAKPPVKLSGAAAKAKANAKPKAEKTVRPCTCGCGEETSAYFVPGHDARFKAWMVKIERGKMEVKDLPKPVQKAFDFKKTKTGYVTTHNYKGEPHKGYDKASA